MTYKQFTFNYRSKEHKQLQGVVNVGYFGFTQKNQLVILIFLGKSGKLGKEFLAEAATYTKISRLERRML